MERMIKYLKSIFLLVLGMILSLGAMAQDEEITDEQLRRYALLQEVVDIMKKEISVELNEMIKAQEGMTGARYKELAATKGDEPKMAAISAKDFEKQFFQITEDMKNDRIEAIKTVNQELATKMLGDRGKVYKRIADALESDAALETRYQAIVAEIKTSSGS
jgi:hypothetical protein